MWKFTIIFSIAFLSICHTPVAAQNAMIPSETLIQNQKEGWGRLQALIKSATNQIEILPANKSKAASELYLCQVTAGSALGAVVYNTGGILVDNGFIRILGSGSTKLDRSIATWNTGKTIQQDHSKPGYFLIADDVIGGLFALNGGVLGNDIGNVYYFPPDDLYWMPMSMPYSKFLEFCFNGDITTFYKDNKWTGWQAVIAKVGTNETVVFSPPLWSQEGKNIETVKKNKVSMENRFKEALPFLTKSK